MIVEFEVYESSSTSGGKVWGYPKGSSHATLTIFGKRDRYLKGAVTVKETAKFDVFDKSREKTDKGYVKLTTRWINTTTGEVLTNYTPPKTVMDVIDEKADLIKMESVTQSAPKGIGLVATPFSSW
jgi:hypothetical protein